MSKNKMGLMLWADDFANQEAWKSICQALELPENTKEIELKVSVVCAFDHKHRTTSIGD